MPGKLGLDLHERHPHRGSPDIFGAYLYAVVLKGAECTMVFLTIFLQKFKKATINKFKKSNKYKKLFIIACNR